jgi:hypothetical protein
MENDMENGRTQTLTVTHGEATSHARIHSDVWDKALEEWLPVQLDAATRAHFQKVTQEARAKVKTAAGRRGIATGEWLLEELEELPVIWGTERAPLALEGEGMMLAGPQGVGKTTIAQQLALALAGLRDECLGLPVRPERGRVLYLAMDRPEQIRRSFQRMVTEQDRPVLAERIVFWRGRLPFTVTDDPTRMASFAREHGATHIIADSYKDMIPKLTDEELASKLNDAVQECIVEGIGWTGVHHNRKANASNPHPKELADIYGSTFLTAGLGSVISLYGEPGGELVEAKHLKQPAETFGTFGIRHDHETGHSELTDDRPEVKTAERGKVKSHDLLEALRKQPDEWFDVILLATNFNASRSTIERKLKALEDKGLVVHKAVGKAYHWQATS